jgi:K+-sensing histidine kinase KdpD
MSPKATKEMMETDSSLTYEELVNENQILHQELEQLSARDKYLWAALVETSRKLQVSSASIKAAVSSLLTYDIFWDDANKHEFLATINISIDQVSELVKLVALGSRLEAGILELKREPHILQEILSVVQETVLKQFPEFKMKVTLPAEESLVEVDYVYLTLALELLLSFFAAKPTPEDILVNVEEGPEYWLIKLKGSDSNVLELMRKMLDRKTQPEAMKNLPAENILKSYIISEILNLQKITLMDSDNKQELSLIVPVCYH